MLLAASADALPAAGGGSPQPFTFEQQSAQAPATSLRHRQPAFARVRLSKFVADRRPVARPSSTRVAIFGDRFAQALAGGLAEDLGASVTSMPVSGDDDAGLMRPDFATWLAALKDRLKPDRRPPPLAVLMIGANDGKPVEVDGVPVDPASERWRELYRERIQAVASAFREAKIRLIWVGLPSVRDEGRSSAFVRLNAIIRDVVERNGATFVDIYDAFLNDAGRYSATGPDVEGDMAKLRRSDGLGFTKAGARKLASFVALDIKRFDQDGEGRAAAPDPNRITIDRPSDFDQALDIDINAQIRREAGLPASGVGREEAPQKPAAGPVIMLTAAPLSPGGNLVTAAGTGPAPVADPDPLRRAPKPGRADDFTWPKP